MSNRLYTIIIALLLMFHGIPTINAASTPADTYDHPYHTYDIALENGSYFSVDRDRKYVVITEYEADYAFCKYYHFDNNDINNNIIECLNRTETTKTLRIPHDYKSTPIYNFSSASSVYAHSILVSDHLFYMKNNSRPAYNSTGDVVGEEYYTTNEQPKPDSTATYRFGNDTTFNQQDRGLEQYRELPFFFHFIIEPMKYGVELRDSPSTSVSFQPNLNLTNPVPGSILYSLVFTEVTTFHYGHLVKIDETTTGQKTPIVLTVLVIALPTIFLIALIYSSVKGLMGDLKKSDVFHKTK